MILLYIVVIINIVIINYTINISNKNNIENNKDYIIFFEYIIINNNLNKLFFEFFLINIINKIWIKLKIILINLYIYIDDY